MTHLVSRIADRDVLACTGAAAGEPLRLAVETVEEGLVCEPCRRLWAEVRRQL